MKADIALLTEDRYIDANPSEQYKKEVLREDQLLSSALKRQGISSVRVSWTDQDFDWTSVSYVMFRSTWDYFYKINQFQNWLMLRENEVSFINSLSLVRWNMDKHYLRDLERNGISIVPTVYVEPNENVELKDLLQEFSSEKLIIKPAVSGTARHTYLVTKENLAEQESIFKKLISEECMLVEPFLKNISENGEISLVIINGEYAHAILKKAKVGDFRVQSDFGGTIQTHQPSREEIDFALAVIKTCETVPVYARVDVARDDYDQLVLVELELIEPDIWLRMNPGSVDKLAQAVKTYIFKA